MGNEVLAYTGERLMPEYEPETSPNQAIHYARYNYALQYVSPHADILDVGCGVGYGTQLLAQVTSGRVVGIDKEDVIDYAQRRYPAANVVYQAGDVNLPQDYGRFDIVVSFDVFEHLSNVEVYLQTIQGALRGSQALGFISTPRSTVSNLSPDNPFHLREYTLNEYCELLCRYFFIDDLLMFLGMLAVLRQSGTEQASSSQNMSSRVGYLCLIEDDLAHARKRVRHLETEIAHQHHCPKLLLTLWHKLVALAGHA